MNKQTIMKILLAVILLAWISVLVYFVERERTQKLHLYRIDVNNQSFWTKEVTLTEGGGIAFLDIESGRTYKIVGTSYIIIEPKK